MAFPRDKPALNVDGQKYFLSKRHDQYQAKVEKYLISDKYPKSAKNW